MLYLTDEKLNHLLTYETLVPALRDMHKVPPEVLEDMLLEQPAVAGGVDRILNRAAWQQGKALGVKLATIFPNNGKDGSDLPSIQALYVLFDGTNGSPQAVMDGTVLTWRKTAADSALGASFLARDDVEHMVMVGAGSMAPELIKAHLSVRPSLRRVSIFNRSAGRADDLVARLSTEVSGVSFIRVDDLEAAVGEADLVCCATMSQTPVVSGAWLRPGTHLDLIGAYTAEMREADDEALRRGRLFVDSRDTTIRHIGELMIPLRTGVIAESDVLADLVDLCRGELPGRQTAEEITIFKNGGGGHLDLMTARHAITRASEEGVA